MGEAHLKKVILKLIETDGEFPKGEMYDFASRRALFWETHLERMMNMTDRDLINTLSIGRGSMEAFNARYATNDLLELGLWLTMQPVLAETGQMEDILDRPRSYADVEAEIANRLATLGRFRALFKTMTDTGAMQHELATSRYEPPQGEDISATVTRVRKRTRVSYCRPREIVEKEIRTRASRHGGDPPASRVVEL